MAEPKNKLTLHTEEIVQLGVILLSYEFEESWGVPEGKEVLEKLQQSGLPEAVRDSLKDLQDEILEAYSEGQR